MELSCRVHYLTKSMLLSSATTDHCHDIGLHLDYKDLQLLIEAQWSSTLQFFILITLKSLRVDRLSLLCVDIMLRWRSFILHSYLRRRLRVVGPPRYQNCNIVIANLCSATERQTPHQRRSDHAAQWNHNQTVWSLSACGKETKRGGVGVQVSGCYAACAWRMGGSQQSFYGGPWRFGLLEQQSPPA